MAGVAQAVIPPRCEPYLLPRPQHRGRLALDFALQFACKAVANFLDLTVLVRRRIRAGSEGDLGRSTALRQDDQQVLCTRRPLMNRLEVWYDEHPRHPSCGSHHSQSRHPTEREFPRSSPLDRAVEVGISNFRVMTLLGEVSDSRFSYSEDRWLPSTR
jgi:hypothetical protein